MIIAAIDIGSNAARLLIEEVKPYADNETDFTKLTLLRVPLRLGMDVFSTGKISKEKQRLFIETLKAYSILMGIYKVEHYRACATSAMRDAANGPALLKKALKETGIKVDIITGQEEANIVYETHIAENLSPAKSYLYIDVGGGSTELTFFYRNKLLHKESFNIGTIRLLQGQVKESEWDALKRFIKNKLKGYPKVEAIGSGGNINKIFSLSKRKDGRPLSLELLEDYYSEFAQATLEERMHRYHFRADRADVIVPALQIYTTVMRLTGAEEIYVPKIGLADGLVRMIYKEKAGTI